MDKYTHKADRPLFRNRLISWVIAIVFMLFTLNQTYAASVRPPQTNYSYDYSVFSDINWADPLDEFMESLLIIPELEWVDDLSDMTRQMTAVAMVATGMVGTFFDASHQLYIQSLIDLEHVRARRAYQPSTALCTFGTLRSGLPSSEARGEINASVLARSALQRDSLHISRVPSEPAKELSARLASFRTRYCNEDYMAGALAKQDSIDGICVESVNMDSIGKDINYTNTIDQPLTLDFNLTDTSVSEDEQDVRALMTNLFSYNLMPQIGDKINKPSNYDNILDFRSIWAGRSLARSTFVHIVGQKSSGTGVSDSYIKDIARSMGFTDNNDDILRLLGENPSYEAQMEFLTKKIYQSPNFIASLIDTPENIRRQSTAILSSKLMLDRDIAKALQKRELLISAILNELLKVEENELSKKLN